MKDVPKVGLEQHSMKKYTKYVLKVLIDQQEPSDQDKSQHRMPRPKGSGVDLTTKKLMVGCPRNRGRREGLSRWKRKGGKGRKVL